MPLLEEGATIRDTYEVERFLGEGAFAEVYRVKHRFLGRQAMKVFKQEVDRPEEVVDMLGEAILLSRIGHPNIVRVFDANVLDTEQGTRGYFTMEYVSGGTLDKFWQSFGEKHVQTETCMDIIKQVCRGLRVAHDANPPIIHRDIKPQNILVGYEAEGLRVRLSDFGLAKELNPLSLLASAAGTLAFKPPEVFGRGKADSRAADVFAVGVTMYLLLADELPFRVGPLLGWSQDATAWKVPSPPSEWNLLVDPALDQIVMKCIDFNPHRRYPSAGDLLSALDSWKAKPRPLAKSMGSSSGSKMALAGTPLDSDRGRQLFAEAETLASRGLLADAADRMEEAFNYVPEFREKYAYRVSLWRRGISM